jgi:hypothetical protein
MALLSHVVDVPHIRLRFASVLMGMLGSTITVSIIGTRFAMLIDPFWTPAQYSESGSQYHWSYFLTPIVVLIVGT